MPDEEVHGTGLGRSSSPPATSGRKRLMIDLNTATAEELDKVPELQGHGFEIVRYREDRGRFTSLRQLNEVPGLAGKVADVETAVTVAES
jgi:competence ComEA-like helix-hairpin-helix protein